MKSFLSIFLFATLVSCSNDLENQKASPIPESRFLGELDLKNHFGGSGEETAQAIVATSDGGYAVLGFSNSMDGDLAGKALPVNDYWLLKFDAEDNLQWNKTYGGSMDDRGQSLVQTQDGGYALTGYAMSSDGDASNNEGFHDNWIIKVDASGALQWEKSFGFSGHDHSYDIIGTLDGGLFFVGFLDVTAARADGFNEKGNTLTRHGVGEFWGTKLDASGNLVWRKYFGGTNNDRAHSVVQADDGGFVMAGFSESNDFDVTNSKGSYDFWVLKTDSEGNLLWERSFGGSGIEISYDIAKTNDNGYVIVGNTFSDNMDVSKNNGESDVWLIKVDDQGNLLWERSFGGSQFDAAQSVCATQDGGYIICGNSKSSDADLLQNVGENDVWLLRTDGNGVLTWQKTFGGLGLDFGFDALETEGNKIILVGETSSPEYLGMQNFGQTDAVILKIK